MSSAAAPVPAARPIIDLGVDVHKESIIIAVLPVRRKPRPVARARVVRKLARNVYVVKAARHELQHIAAPITPAAIPAVP